MNKILFQYIKNTAFKANGIIQDIDSIEKFLLILENARTNDNDLFHKPKHLIKITVYDGCEHMAETSSEFSDDDFIQTLEDVKTLLTNREDKLSDELNDLMCII